jgi:Mu transposase, C-terminal./Mu DNA binding, I gamma subdomain./Integrase core domain.
VANLTVKEVADLKGCSEQYIRKMIKNRKIEAIESDRKANNHSIYLIPTETLPDDLKVKYLSTLVTAIEEPIAVQKPAKQKRVKKEVIRKPFDSYSKTDREIIEMWISLLKKWHEDRSYYKNKVEADKTIVGSLQNEYHKMFVLGDIPIEPKLSVPILYRKYAAYKDENLDGLLDQRGVCHRGKSTVPDILFDQFLYYYLDQRQPSLSMCYQMAIEAAQQFYPELVSQVPHEQSFRRKLKSSVPEALIAYLRKGEKVAFDLFAPYIERWYGDLEANDVWVADNHTWDIMVMSEDGTEQIHRMYLTGFMDAKSGAMVGWNVTDNPCSNSTIFALRHGIIRHGIPKMIYLDNGTEFLTKDIAGRGHRTRKSQLNVPKPETILSRLGVEMKNAIVRNAKAKPIERTFYTLKEHISKLYSSYCGGTIMERPESLKKTLKDKNSVPTDSRFRAEIDTLIEGIYNLEDYGGSELKYQGMSRLDVWNDSIQNVVQRVASLDDLNLLLMRSSQYQKVKRNGVHLTIADEKIWYSPDDEIFQYQGQEVYLRYDPTDLREVRIYDTEDRYLYTWKVERELLLNFMESDVEALQTASEKVARNKKAIRDHAKGLTANLPDSFKIDMLDLRIRKAELAREGIIIEQSNVVEVVRADHTKEEYHNALQTAVGAEGVVVDMNRMNQNAARRKK